MIETTLSGYPWPQFIEPTLFTHIITYIRASEVERRAVLPTIVELIVLGIFGHNQFRRDTR